MVFLNKKKKFKVFVVGKYLIIIPAAQMCNRMRSHMGAIYLGLLTKRIVLIDIATDRYAARLNTVFYS